MDSHEDNNLSKVKSSIIEEINRRYEDHSIEETNAALIKRLVQKSETINDALMIWNLGTRFSKTGIQFDRDFEKVLDEKDTIHYLKRNPKLSFKTDENAPLHKLIIGENFHALKNLLISYRGKVDVIYIDPPYGKDSMGEFAATNYHNALSRDNLLTMLEIRLEIAKMLLSDTGVIFCSIDDKNQAYVKCLFDDIFGERNFVANLVVVSAPAGTQSATDFAQQHSYCLVYRNTSLYKPKYLSLNTNEIDLKYTDGNDENGRYYTERIWKRGIGGRKEDVPSLHFPVWYNESTKQILIDDEINAYNRDDFIQIIPYQTVGVLGRWTWSKDKMRSERNKLIVVKTGNEFKLKKKVYENDEKGIKPHTIIDSKIGRTELGSLELKNIMGGKYFDYPKFSGFIKYLISLQENPSSIVLDFFAGSGTTAQAVQELNKEDGGSRECILVQMDEKTATTPNGIATDVTSKRLKRVMTGSCYDGSADFEWIKKHAPIGGNLDVYEIGEVSVYEDKEGQSAFDVIDETIYGCEKFGSLKERVDWICSNFSITTPRIEQIEQRDENA